LGSVGLLNPNLVNISNAHRLTLVSIMMSHNRLTAESRLDPVTHAPTAAQKAARSAVTHTADISCGFPVALRETQPPRPNQGLQVQFGPVDALANPFHSVTRSPGAADPYPPALLIGLAKGFD
jgi:hypothetical protein